MTEEQENIKERWEREAQEFADRAERWKDERRHSPMGERIFAYWKKNTVWCLFIVGLVLLIGVGSCMGSRA